MKKFFNRSWHEEQGQNSAEYALMLILVILAVVAVIQIMGATLHNSYSSASSAMSATAGQGSPSNSGPAGSPHQGEDPGRRATPALANRAGQVMEAGPA